MADSEKSLQHETINMFNIQNLSDFLSRNVHPDLYPRLLNGKLVAYSSPFAIAQMQAEAALVSMAWKANASSSSPSKAPLSSLTIEANDYNVVACPIQNNLLLVLNGTKKDDGTSSFKITPTLADSAEDLEDDSHLEEDVVALTARGSSSPRLHALTLQRRKVQRIAKTVEAEAQFLRIPDDSPYG